MIGLAFDLILAGFSVAVLCVVLQFQTGFMLNKNFKIGRLRFRVDGEKKKRIVYTCWKEVE